jgi:hypothetical protein
VWLDETADRRVRLREEKASRLTAVACEQDGEAVRLVGCDSNLQDSA